MELQKLRINSFSSLSGNINYLLDKQMINYLLDIAEEIRRGGDEAVLKYIKKFDKVEDIGKFSLKVSEGEIREYEKVVDSGIKEIFLKAFERILEFHLKQWEKLKSLGIEMEVRGRYIGQIVNCVDSVMVYAPGGLAVYPSSLLMGVAPAIACGVKNIFLATPPKSDGTVDPMLAVLAKEIGVKEIYKVGGAVAVFAFAFGTKTIPKVEKIVGPGNIYFTLAKKLVEGIVGIDILAGPSEIALILTEKSNLEFASSDLLSQLEHSPNTKAFVIYTNEEIYKKFLDTLERRIELLEDKIRRSILEPLNSNTYSIKAKDLDEALEIVNIIAPEHLEIMEEVDIRYVKDKVKSAGTVLIGNNTPTALSDYIAGVNHILPTDNSARFSSPYGVYHLIKFTNIVKYSEKALKEDGINVVKMAEYEGLPLHADSIKIRLENTNE